MPVARIIPEQQRIATNWRILPRRFFDRNPPEVARDLLGKLLVRQLGKHILAGRVVETEAYLGQNDDAAHAAAGRTPRNAVLFGPPGHAYVYFIYGNHYCLNVSCLPKGEAGCVLFRALEPVTGVTEMMKLRKLRSGLAPARMLSLLTTGPGRLCQALAITRNSDNGKDLVAPRSDLQLMDDGFTPREIIQTCRVGITKSADHPLRYLIGGNKYVSGSRT